MIEIEEALFRLCASRCAGIGVTGQPAVVACVYCGGSQRVLLDGSFAAHDVMCPVLLGRHALYLPADGLDASEEARALVHFRERELVSGGSCVPLDTRA